MELCVRSYLTLCPVYMFLMTMTIIYFFIIFYTRNEMWSKLKKANAGYAKIELKNILEQLCAIFSSDSYIFHEYWVESTIWMTLSFSKKFLKISQNFHIFQMPDIWKKKVFQIQSHHELSLAHELLSAMACYRVYVVLVMLLIQTEIDSHCYKK